MKLVHLIFSLETGGTENLLIDIVNEQTLTSTVDVIIINDKIDSALVKRIDNNVKIHMLNRKPGSKYNYWFLLKLWWVLFKLKPQVIHCHNENIIPLLPFFKRKCVVTIHDVGYPVRHLKKYKKVFSISHAVAEDLGRSSITSSVVHNGINFSLYKRRVNYILNDSIGFKICQVSRLMHEKKGQDILLKALFILIKELGVPKISLDIIGSGESKDFLENLTQQLDLQQHVKFLNNKDRQWVQHHLQDYHLLVQPSRYEGLGLTVIEGIAAGLPVVASDIEGPAEILEQVPSGILFPAGDEYLLAEAIAQVIEHYKDGQIGHRTSASYLKIKEKYSVQKTAKEYLHNYS